MYLLIFPQSVLCQKKSTILFTPADYVNTIKMISEVMMHDIVSPPAASRYYAYTTIAGYEVISQLQPDQFPDLKNKLNSFPDFQQATSADNINLSLAVIYATIRMGGELLPSGSLLDSLKGTILQKAKKNLDESTFSNTISFSESIITTLLQYSGKDHYREINGLTKYTPKKNPGSWKPTPPAYMQALDPYWNHIRSFTLDSAAQFKPTACISYSEDSTADFFQAAMEVYRVGKNLTEEQKAIADFWDCNPFAVMQEGHIDYGLKKISPGGHWMGIAGIACLKKNLSLQQTIRIHTVLAIAIADGFISCWDEKYRSNRIRPETFINEKIDRNWRPLLQTPPFPEYPSGHSVVSGAAATVLTKLIGDNFQYTDVTEKEFGLPARSFRSFKDAAAEATISRLYGGIHFRDAVVNGALQGAAIGQWVLSKLGL
ncbi:MAG TPA: vanadium-dependent haloperoxidase [Chitinophagales bacterium]|nr:vanadium-dependent haloperoxidase [Chitinophagales bacterium]